jgi:hypothetical protein
VGGFKLRRNLIFLLTPLVLAGIVVMGVRSMASGAGDVPVPAKTTTAAVPPPASDPAAAVHAAEATAPSDEKLGVAVLDRVTGKETDGTAAHTTFPCASVLKLFLITDLFHQQEQGTIKLSSTDLTEINSALTISNDAAMNTLWGKYHGQAAIQQLIDIAKLPDAQIPPIVATGKWGGVLISPRDVLAVYSYLLTKLTAADRDLIVNTLNQANPVGYQDFNQAFGLLNPKTRTATTKAKQGWSAWQGATVLNSTGILDGRNDVVVAVLTSRAGHGSAAQYDAARTELDNATTALIRQLGS